MKKFLPVIALVGAALCGCDEGRIWPDDVAATSSGGMTVRAEIRASRGADRWFGGYTLALAGFNPESEYALISKNIEPDPEGNATLTLSGVPAEVATVEICVIDRLRRRVASFVAVAAGSSEVTLSAEGEDFSPENAIQTEVFNTTCINCHGGASFSAGGLNLTAGRAFGELIGVPSVKSPERMRVNPGSPESSILYQILAGDESRDWKYDHSVEITASERLDLIRNWITAQ